MSNLINWNDVTPGQIRAKLNSDTVYFPPKIEVLSVKLLDGGIAPKRMTSGAAGYDLFTPQEIYMPPNTQQLVPLKIQIAIPNGYHGQIWPRSSLDCKQNITTGAGIIDVDYRGEVMVLLRSLNSAFPVTIAKGERIAQLILVPNGVFETQIVDILPTTDRGSGGFGSTGK